MPKQDIYYHEKRCIFQLVRCIILIWRPLSLSFQFPFTIKGVKNKVLYLVGDFLTLTSLIAAQTKRFLKYKDVN